MPSHILTPLFTKSVYSLPDVANFVQARLRPLEVKLSLRSKDYGYEDDRALCDRLRGVFNDLQNWERQGFATVVTDKPFSDIDTEYWPESLRPNHSAKEATSIGTAQTQRLRSPAPDVSLQLVKS
jgi:hypothetical protein